MKNFSLNNTKVVILTEGGKKFGLGHVIRCIALRQAFEEKNINPEIIINCDKNNLALPKTKKFKFFNWLNNKNKLLKIVADIVIVDSFVANINLYRTISGLVGNLVCIDDNIRLNYPKSIVVNVSLNSNEMNYPKNKNIKYLLGTKYTILRREFWSETNKKIKKNIKNIMVTFGGYDKNNLTSLVLSFLVKKFPGTTKNIILGHWSNNSKNLLKIADKNTVIIRNPNAKKIKKLMLLSDISISAGGQTLYEMARIGLPVVGVATAKNQLHNINSWKKIGFLEYAGVHNDKKIIKKIFKAINKILPFYERKKRSKIGRKYLDGKGAKRACSFLLNQKKNKITKFKNGNI